MFGERLLISVIVPCFNHGEYLAEALNSIARQTYRNWECLIIDDGSSDNTPEVASQFAKRDSRYRYLHHAHKGLGASRNRGIAVARGELTQFLDADDVIAPEKFELQMVMLGNLDSLKIVHCDYAHGRRACITKQWGTKRLPATFIFRKPIYDLALRWESELSIPIHCFLFDSRIFHDYGIRFEESLPNHEDWECWMRVFALEPESLFVDRVLAIYRSPGSMTSNRRRMYGGFLLALAKQARAWSHDPTMSSLLGLMRKRIEYVYKPDLRGEGWASTLQESLMKAYTRTVPWPLQQAVTRFREAQLKPDQELLRAITRGGGSDKASY